MMSTPKKFAILLLVLLGIGACAYAGFLIVIENNTPEEIVEPPQEEPEENEQEYSDTEENESENDDDFSAPEGSDVGMEFPIPDNNPQEPVACTMDAKQCPDGSYVGRVPPHCAFAACPDEGEEMIGLPYCNTPEEGRHESLARTYLETNHNSYRLDSNSQSETGPCNNGNTAWSLFTVYDTSENAIGTVTVNGDTEEVVFEAYE